MYHLLLPIDESNHRAKKTVNTVRDFPTDSDNLRSTILYVSENGATEAPESVTTAAAQLEEAGCEVETTIKNGYPPEEIVNQVEELDVDHVLMVGREKTTSGKILFGSATESVMESVDVPVTVVKE